MRAIEVERIKFMVNSWLVIGLELNARHFAIITHKMNLSPSMIINFSFGAVFESSPEKKKKKRATKKESRRAFSSATLRTRVEGEAAGSKSWAMRWPQPFGTMTIIIISNQICCDRKKTYIALKRSDDKTWNEKWESLMWLFFSPFRSIRSPREREKSGAMRWWSDSPLILSIMFFTILEAFGSDVAFRRNIRIIHSHYVCYLFRSIRL